MSFLLSSHANRSQKWDRGQSVIPLVNADGSLCCHLSLPSPWRHATWVTLRVGNERLALIKTKECPLLPPVTTAICTCTALALPEHQSIEREQWKTLHPRLWEWPWWGHTTCNTDSGGYKMLYSAWVGTAQLLSCVHFCTWFMTGTTWGLALGALLTVVSLQPWQKVKTWAILPAGDWVLLWPLHEKQAPIKPFPKMSPLVISWCCFYFSVIVTKRPEKQGKGNK